jgi:hypothetical protein
MADDDGVYVEDWSELNVAELREELKARGLSTSGKRDELVARLEASDGEDETDEPPDAPEPTPPAEEPPGEGESPGLPAESASGGESDGEPVATSFDVTLDIPDDYDDGDEDQDLAWKLEARSAAIAAGYRVYSAVYSASLLRFDGDTVTYRVPVSGKA